MDGLFVLLILLPRGNVTLISRRRLLSAYSPNNDGYTKKMLNGEVRVKITRYLHRHCIDDREKRLMSSRLKPLKLVAKVKMNGIRQRPESERERERREEGLARSLRNQDQRRKGTPLLSSPLRSSDAIAVAGGSTFAATFCLPPLPFFTPSFLRKRLSPLSIFECNEQETLKGHSLPQLSN